MQDLQQLLSDIHTGIYDDDIERLAIALRRRENAIASDTFYTVEVGDLVRFNNKTRPKYLQGATATVVDKNTTRLVVKLTKPAGKYSEFSRITVPALLVDPA